MKQKLGSVGSRISSVFGVVGALAFSASASVGAVSSSPIDFLQKDGRFTFFVKLLTKSGTNNWLLHSATHDTTLFAPTDDAFTHLPQSVIEDLQKNPDALKWAVHYHIVTSRLTPASLRLGPKALTGETLSLTGGLPAHTARIVESHSAGDMIVDVVDEVLISPEALKQLRRDGAVPITSGLAPSAPMTADSVNSFGPIFGSATPPVSGYGASSSSYAYQPDPYAYYYYGADLYPYMFWGGQSRRYPSGGTTIPQRQPARTPPVNPPAKNGNGNGNPPRP